MTRVMEVEEKDKLIGGRAQVMTEWEESKRDNQTVLSVLLMLKTLPCLILQTLFLFSTV